jgi:hypothetical protein
MSNNNTQFRGNNRLLPQGTVHSYTQEQVDEYKQCFKDPEYFIETYIKIRNLDSPKLVDMKLRPYQKRIVDAFFNDRFIIIKMPRQSGKSIVLMAIICHLINFQDNFEILIAANKASSALELMKRIKVGYENLPPWLKQNVVKWNEMGIELENGSKVTAIATSADAGRSGSYNLVLLDEFAFVEQNVADEFYTSVFPTISSGTDSRLVIISTPNGMNHFHKMWQEAVEKQSRFLPIEINWDDVPGRDAEFKKNMIMTLGSEDRWIQEFEAQFIGKSDTLISATKLKTIAFRPPVQTVEKLRIFEKPQKDHVYFISVDVSHGKGLDYSAMCVMDITQAPFRVVATFKDDTVSTLLYPSLIQNVARIYNDAHVLLEINDIGQEVANILYYELEYENILWVSTNGRAGQVLTGDSGTNMGVKMSKTTRPVGCNTLKALIENDQLFFYDFDILSELSNFILKGGRYEADTGMHDDLVMCLVGFAWATTFEFFKELNDTNIRQIMYEEKMRQMEEELVPFGIVHTGPLDDDDEFIGDMTQWMRVDPEKKWD